MPHHKRHHRFMLALLAAGLLAGVSMTANSAQAASGVGPFFPEPAWDRKLPASFRFYVLTDWNNAAVLDKETGLVWERSPAQTAPWYTARLLCATLTTGNRRGWRLPSVHELNSLFAPSVLPFQGILALPAGHPFNIPTAKVWSATLDVANPNAAWAVDFNGDGVVSIIPDLTNTGLWLWCVRGASNEHQY